MAASFVVDNGRISYAGGGQEEREGWGGGVEKRGAAHIKRCVVGRGEKKNISVKFHMCRMIREAAVSPPNPNLTGGEGK